MWEFLIKQNPRNIRLYKGKNFEHLMKIALEEGYIPSYSDIKSNRLIRAFVGKNVNLFRECIKKNPRSIVYYEGVFHREELLEEAFLLGYQPTINDLRICYKLANIPIVIRKLIEQNPRNIVYYRGNDYGLYEEAIKLGYIPTIKDLNKFPFLARIDDIMRILIEQDPKNIVYYRGDNEELLEQAIALGYVPNRKDFEKSLFLSSSNIFLKEMIRRDPSAILLYEGHDEEIFALAIESGFRPTKKVVEDEFYLLNSVSVMKYLIEKDPSAILIYHGEDLSLITLALEKGYKPNIDDVFENDLLTRHPVIAEMLITEKSENINYFTYSEESMLLGLKIFENKYGVKVPDYYAPFLKFYRGDLCYFCMNYPKISKFLSELGIDEEKFCQIVFSRTDDYISKILEIVDSEKIENFKEVKEFLFDNFYSLYSGEHNNFKVDSILNLLKNYSVYPELCNDIINQKRQLTEEELTNLFLLFRMTDVFETMKKPMNVSELGIVLEQLKSLYSDKFEEKKLNSLDVLCGLLFGVSSNEVRGRLSIYGDRKVLRQLLFNNRDNPEMVEQIRKMMVCTTFMQDIINIDNPSLLQQVINRTLNNFGEVSKLIMQFYGYEESMRLLYERDIQSNLTRCDQIRDISGVRDDERTGKYGVEVLDFSDRKYCLLAHVMSSRETPEELVRGDVARRKKFISLSSISHRNQVYYTNPGSDTIIFATDVLPDGVFLQSSVSNMGSNSHIRDGVEVEEINRKQRGIVETSQAENGNNSEVLTYREGVEFRYIILPGGREPTEEELRLAREYGLKFVVTQPVRTSINNPTDIEMVDHEEKTSEVQEERTTTVVQEEVSVVEVPKVSHGPKRIAILTDVHGLFEPTLAVLEDARKRGITEIYSLGDNIGTGPNPSEVMDLLEEYGVISIVGNHELYITEGVDAFKEHLDHAGPHAYQEALRNSQWTALQLSEEQRKRLSVSDKMIELTLGGKRILLCHDTKDFNTDKVVVDTSSYDEVIKGHKHFGKKEGNVTTLPGVGIGTNVGKATYLILTENENGGYSSEIIVVRYDTASVGHSIRESDMDEVDKSKIESWVGVSDGKRGKK